MKVPKKLRGLFKELINAHNDGRLQIEQTQDRNLICSWSLDGGIVEVNREINITWTKLEEPTEFEKYQL